MDPRVLLLVVAASLAGCGGGSSRATFLDRTAERRARPAAAKAKAKAPAKASAHRSSTKVAEPTLGTLRLASAFELLGGRIALRLPEGARPAALPDRPGALLVELGSGRIVLAAVELFARRGDDLEDGARAEVEHWGQRPSSFAIDRLANPNCEVVRVVPAEGLFLGLREGIDDLALVDVLYVGSPDGTVQEIELHANGAAARDRDAVTALAGRIGTTVRPGIHFDTSGGPRTFTVFRRGPELRVDVPEGTIAVEEEGDSSEAYSLHVLRPLGGDGGSIRITVGGSPGVLPPEGRRVRGEMLGAPAQWMAYASSGGLELRLIHLAGEQPISVIIRGPSGAVVDSLLEVVETVRLSQPCQGPSSCPAGERCRAEYCRRR